MNKLPWSISAKERVERLASAINKDDESALLVEELALLEDVLDKIERIATSLELIAITIRQK